jgi:hypothetical protein
MKIVMIGIDLGKNLCSVAGLDESGAVVLRRTGVCVAIYGAAEAMHGGDGGMLRSPPSGPADCCTRPRCTADVSGICSAICQSAKE